MEALGVDLHPDRTHFCNVEHIVQHTFFYNENSNHFQTLIFRRRNQVHQKIWKQIFPRIETPQLKMRSTNSKMEIIPLFPTKNFFFAKINEKRCLKMALAAEIVESKNTHFSRKKNVENYHWWPHWINKARLDKAQMGSNTKIERAKENKFAGSLQGYTSQHLDAKLRSKISVNLSAEKQEKLEWNLCHAGLDKARYQNCCSPTMTTIFNGLFCFAQISVNKMPKTGFSR